MASLRLSGYTLQRQRIYIYIYIYILYIVKKILKGVGRRKVNLMMLYFTGKIMANWKKFLFAMLMISFGDISV